MELLGSCNAKEEAWWLAIEQQAPRREALSWTLNVSYGSLCQVPVEPQDPQQLQVTYCMHDGMTWAINVNEAFASSTRALSHGMTSCKRPFALTVQVKHVTVPP